MPSVSYLLDETAAVSAHRLRVSDTPKATKIVHGKKVFRAGTFKDSSGTLHTWTIEQLDQTVANFHHLRENNLLGAVPLRVDHTFSARDVVGWISDLYREGDYLLADLHFTETAAFSKWDNGTFEPVSSELAPYETNSGDIYYPTLIGVAFVDIPAVEGLFRASSVDTERVTAVFVNPSMLDSKTGSVYERGTEDHMPASSTPTKSPFNPELSALTTAELLEQVSTHTAKKAAPKPAAAEEAPAAEAPAEVETPAEAPAEAGAADEAPAAPAAPAVESPTPKAPVAVDPPAAAEVEGDPTEPPTPTAPVAVDPAAPVEVVEGEPIPVTEPRDPAVHGAAHSVMTFRVNGVPLTDPAVVQAHIDALETFRSSHIDGERREFVTGLVRDNKILAGQAEALTDLALSMDLAQFSKFKASYEAAGASPLMASHGRSGDASAPVMGGKSMEDIKDELSIHSPVIERHKLTGKPQEWIEQTESFRRYTELNTQLQG